ncbi:MAG: DUF4252 domain-containing protein [Dysgonomonadaceae bacterium]|nr:DUF4252 domain-containing protein [Dysgonamonadaceae bacterium]
MRKLLIAILFVVCAANLSAQKNSFEQFTEMDGVTSVYISKNMLSLFPKNAKNNYGGIDVGNFLHKLSSILILTTEDKNIGKRMVSLANNQIKTDNYELLMRVKSDDDDNVNFFMKGKPESIRELIMIVDDSDDESVILQFLGDFTLQDIQKMTEGFGKD